jgi:AcrR family transcriptional regulator
VTEADTPAAGRRYHHGDLKSALISSAAELLERDGAEALSFRAVARAAGVSQAAPYKHFSGKDELLATVAEAGFRALEASQVEAATEAFSSHERIVTLGMDYIEFAIAYPQRYRLMFGVGVADWHAHPAIAEAKRATFGPIRAALAEYLGTETAPETLEASAIAAWGLVHGLSMLKIDGSLRDDLQRENAALRLFVAGLANACSRLQLDDDGDMPH